MGSTFNALFCTAPNCASKINELLQHADEESQAAGNIFCLIQSPTQKSVEKPTSHPVPDFDSGFQEWSIEDIGKWCKEKFDWKTPKSQPPYIAAEEFAVVDQRTLRDGTVLLAKYDCWRERIDPDSQNDADEASWEHRGYRTVRSLLKDAADTMMGFSELDMSEMLTHLKPEDDGVMKWTSR